MVTTPFSGRVAAVIPVSRAASLSDTLDSVLLQSRPPDEVVVVDRGSEPELVRRAIAPHADRVLLVRERHGGVGVARNAGIAATRADYIAVLDGSDRWLPHFLATQIQRFRQEGDVDLSFTNGLFVGQSELAGVAFMPRLEGHISIDALLMHGRSLPCSAVVMRRSLIVQVGGFDTVLEQGLDFDLWARLASRGARVRGSSKILVLRRPEGDVDAVARLNEVAAAMRAAERLLESGALPADRLTIERHVRRLRAEMEKARGTVLLERGDVRAARAAFSAACEGPHDWRVRATQVALAIVPWVVRRVYTARWVHASE
jgi:glycosyltransferase involved in cell wall biosynthesis